jgi:hypothetical protein
MIGVCARFRPYRVCINDVSLFNWVDNVKLSKNLNRILIMNYWIKIICPVNAWKVIEVAVRGQQLRVPGIYKFQEGVLHFVPL